MSPAIGFTVRPIRILASVMGLVGFAGCYNAAALPEGAPCQRSEQCPESQQCVLGSCSLSAPPADAHPTSPADATTDAMADAMAVACVADGLTCASGTAPVAFPCGTHCWVKCMEMVPRATAETRCNGWTGALGEVDNADEDSCVNQRIGTTPALWIGMIQGAGATTPDDKWAWNGAAPVTYKIWRAVTEPDDGDGGVEMGNEQCGTIRPGGGFDDDPCAQPYPFFCTRPLFR
ncbi:MAG TPA: C-type lectin domain-containing protein [Kofleriaceae bacterium]|jgi:hypothetical protein|nr:C-type lectin domain-containing protein [Kofleriaceae bacterium]